MDVRHARTHRGMFRVAALSAALMGVYGPLAYADSTLDLSDGESHSIPSVALPDTSPYSYIDVRNGSSLDATGLTFDSTRGGQQGALTAMGGSIDIRNSSFTL